MKTHPVENALEYSEGASFSNGDITVGIDTREYPKTHRKVAIFIASRNSLFEFDETELSDLIALLKSAKEGTDSLPVQHVALYLTKTSI